MEARIQAQRWLETLSWLSLLCPSSAAWPGLAEMCSLRGSIQSCCSFPCQLHFSHHDPSFPPTFWNALPFQFLPPLDLILFHKKNIVSGDWEAGPGPVGVLGLFLRLSLICPPCSSILPVCETGRALSCCQCGINSSAPPEECDHPKSGTRRLSLPCGSFHSSRSPEG